MHNADLPLAHRPSISSAKPAHAHTQSYSSLPVLSTPAPTAADTPPPKPEMYLARAPRPQKQPGWLSYMFGTTPGHAETSDPEKEGERRGSVGTLDPVIPGTFPVSTPRETREEGVRSSRPAEAAKPSKPTPVVAPTTTLVLPSTYVKASVQPQTFASTLASPPVITGTPAYGLSSARGNDGLSSAERIRKEWMDAQKEARKAARREARRREREAARAEQRNSESRVQQVRLSGIRFVSQCIWADMLIDHHPTTGHCSNASAGNARPALPRFPRRPDATYKTRPPDSSKSRIDRQRTQRRHHARRTPSPHSHAPLTRLDDPVRRSPASGVDAATQRMGRPRRPFRPR